ncbi:glycosyltransferase family 8 protein [Pseudooceanicola algae]|uniref:Uncharacterized protein n=1 Tax=Pseudooceanicola algae TaxID=1537215 RepID=A0A418SEP3_9RHOB|nr:glycosyltransferase [Pseudooceanicola algae]QPM89787.1 hypothetical protein PSAL_010130 [Pseudooceanicola algae]
MPLPHYTYVFDRDYSYLTLVSVWSLLQSVSGPCEVLLLTDAAPKGFSPAVDKIAEAFPKAGITLTEAPAMTAVEAHFWIYGLRDHLDCKTLLIDGDTCVMQDPAPLFDTDLGGHSLGAIRDIPYLRLWARARLPFRAARYRTKMEAYLGRDLLPASADYFNAGVILVDLPGLSAGPLWPMFDVDLAPAETERLGLPRRDQGWLNHAFAGNIQPLDLRWNAIDPEGLVSKPYLPRAMKDQLRRATDDPGIFHFAGGFKPWDPETADTNRFTPSWHRARAVWQAAAQQVSDATGRDIVSLANGRHG